MSRGKSNKKAGWKARNAAYRIAIRQVRRTKLSNRAQHLLTFVSHHPDAVIPHTMIPLLTRTIIDQALELARLQQSDKKVVNHLLAMRDYEQAVAA